MKPVYVLADDLTGAADTGVCFRRAGLNVMISLSPTYTPACEVIVLDTESRNVPEEVSKYRIHSTATRLLDGGVIYKKIDSTLRGYPGSELAELMAVMSIEKVLVAPAFPAQGRTTIGGRQLIHGVPIENTQFGQEVRDSDLAKLFRACGRQIHLIPLDLLRKDPVYVREVFNTSRSQLIIGDAETEPDLQILAENAYQSGIRLFCGSAGLASALAMQISAPFPVKTPNTHIQHPGSVLVIAGSRNPVTAEQVNTAQKNGIAVFEFNQSLSLDEGQFIEPVIQAVQPNLLRGQDVILSSSTSNDSPLGSAGVAEKLALYAQHLLSTYKIGGLVLTGGDTARAVISGLDSKGVKLEGEILPGIPYGTLVGGNQPDLPVITKAGGFGSKDVLIKAIQFLRAD